MNIDYQSLPRLRDSISYVYCEHAIVEQEDSSIVSPTHVGMNRHAGDFGDRELGKPHACGDEPQCSILISVFRT